MIIFLPLVYEEEEEEEQHEREEELIVVPDIIIISVSLEQLFELRLFLLHADRKKRCCDDTRYACLR